MGQRIEHRSKVDPEVGKDIRDISEVSKTQHIQGLGAVLTAWEVILNAVGRCL